MYIGGRNAGCGFEAPADFSQSFIPLVGVDPDKQFTAFKRERRRGKENTGKRKSQERSDHRLSLILISEPTRQAENLYDVLCLKKINVIP